MKKYVVSIGVIVSLILVTFANEVFATEMPKIAIINNKEYYQIDSEADLFWFAELVNAGNNSCNAVLIDDIVVNKNLVSELITIADTGTATIKNGVAVTAWDPIGNNNYPFNGTFDGQNHTVSGLYVNNSSYNALAGLFGVISTGTVQNVGIRDSYFFAEESGCIAGYSNGRVSACNAASSVVSGSDHSGYIGGIVGNNGGTITDCLNQSEAKSMYTMSCVGGIAGGNGGTISLCHNMGKILATNGEYFGGIAGYNEGMILECSNNNTIKISSDNYFYVGGIVGYNHDGTICKCYNLSEVQGTSTDVMGGCLGGIAGRNLSEAPVSNCFNLGSIKGIINSTSVYVGGLLGANDGIISNCYDAGRASTMGTTSSDGGLGVEAPIGYAGRIIGNNRQTARNCFFTKDDAYSGYAIGTGNGHTTYVGGKTTEQFASGEVAWLLNNKTSTGDIAWGQILSGDSADAYPIFNNGDNTVCCGYATCDTTELGYSNETIHETQGHAFSIYISNNDATCENDGTKTAKCDYGCGEEDVVDDSGSQIDHKYTTYLPNDDATCISNGTATAFCDYGCGVSMTVSVAGTQLLHSYITYISNDDATCFANGTETSICEYGCGFSDTRIEEDSRLEHSYTIYVTNSNATCFADETEIAYCDRRCGTSDIRNIEGTQLVHSYMTYVSDNNATCTADSTKRALCEHDCGTCDVLTEPGTMLGHVFTRYIFNYDQTCTANGTSTAKCDRKCGETHTKIVNGSMKEHVYTNYVFNDDATCYENGTETAICDYGCGTLNTRFKENSRVPHDFTEWEIAKEATCTDSGWEWRYCKNDDCLASDNVEYRDIPALEHSFTEKVSAMKVSNATCTTPTTYYVQCDNCSAVSDTKTVFVGSALGHNMQQTAAKMEATCEAEGKEAVLTCTNGCGKSEGGTVIPAKGHNMHQTAAKMEATCEAEGKEAVLTCTNGCGKSDGGAVILAKGHDMQEISAKVEATCEADGKEAILTCTNGCGKSEGGAVIPAKGHSYQVEFSWQRDLCVATTNGSCDCGDRQSQICRITTKWNKAIDTLELIASSVLGGKTYTDIQTIKLVLVNGRLTIKNSAIGADEKMNMVIMVAGYGYNGQMTGCQNIGSVTGVTETTLTVTGNTIKVFFLKLGTYTPIFECAGL